MIKEETCNNAIDWLAENTDKWDDTPKFHWVVENPELVVPPYVFEYLRAMDESDKFWDDIFEVEKGLGL